MENVLTSLRIAHCPESLFITIKLVNLAPVTVSVVALMPNFLNC
jgi:hypothetical protein